MCASGEDAAEPGAPRLGSKVAMRWRDEPGQLVQDDLRHFKQVVEIGEIVLSDATRQRGRPPDRAARGDRVVRERRHGLGDRRLLGAHRQVPDQRGAEAARGYRIFNDKLENCEKVVLTA